jgi:hypothetical protein
VEPELSDLFFAALQGPVNFVFLLLVDKQPEHGMPEVAAAALRCLLVPPRRRHLG